MNSEQVIIQLDSLSLDEYAELISAIREDNDPQCLTKITNKKRQVNNVFTT